MRQLNYMNNLTITVVTASYNQGQFLSETIQSVISQEGDFWIDYIIIDGGSKDDSVEIIKSYEKILVEKQWNVRCRGITYRWISERDRGQADAIMKGFRLANGEILAWLNSDDVYLPGALQSAMDCFQGAPSVSFYYGNAYYCDEAGEVVGQYPVEEFELEKLAHFNFFCQPSTFFRRTAYDAVGGLNESLSYALDYDLFVRLTKQFPSSYAPRFLSKYRLHETSKTVQDNTLFENHEEVLHLAMQHFGWAPITRVYGACNYFCLARLPGFLTRSRPLAITVAIISTIIRSLILNRGLCWKDLRFLNRKNFKKLFHSRIEILRG